MGSAPAPAHQRAAGGLSGADRAALNQRIGALAAAFAEAGHRFYLVGGLVRDWVAGRKLSGDIDITTDATPEQSARLADRWADTVWEQGKAFGTIGARRGTTTVEITTHRAESYDPASRKPQVRFSDDIATDLGRRDFTVNAMAIEVPGWMLLDPFGGAADLAAGVLRTPSPPESLFSDDPLRMLRAARFCAQLDLKPVPEIFSAVAAMRPRLSVVSRERIADELSKLLRLARPSAGIRYLADTGLLGDVLRPWAACGADAAVPTEALDGLDGLGDLSEARWAALLGPACNGEEDEEDESAAVRCLKSLRLSSATVSKTAAILRAAHALEDAAGARQQAWPRAAREFIAAHGAHIDAAMAVLGAWGRPLREPLAGSLVQLHAAEGEALQRLPLDGRQVMEILQRCGPVIGEALAWLRDQQIRLGPLSAEQARRLVREWSGAGPCADPDDGAH